MTNEKSLYCYGISLIMEGDTEKYFYEEILNRICYDNNINISKEEDSEELAVYYKLNKNENSLIVKIKNTETITQMTNQYLWFKNFCADKYRNIKWTVFLCYDTDGNKISVFSNHDWKLLKDQLNKITNVDGIIDCCADRDIEDMFLIDIDGIKNFLDITENVKVEELKGRKGKVKLKNLYLLYTDKTYHEGKRALPLIRSLDLRKIINNPENNINLLEKLIVDILTRTSK